MTLFEILLLGLALSADAFSVTISNTFVYANERRRRLLLMPVFFGAFQALMPLLGYFLGGVAASFIEKYAGIVTLLILGVIGGNMVREGIGALRAAKRGEADEVAAARADQHLTIGTLVFQAIATAIDAFAVGVSLRAQNVNLILSVSVIGITTAVCCVIAIFLGKKLGRLLGDRAEVVGGLVLIGIGVKAFLGL
ncbi:MAG: manganese efflux pump MntP family protein [Olegusella sp.]|nr:manganese efflux pump MntP family protein [Olegusella sp.]